MPDDTTTPPVGILPPGQLFDLPPPGTLENVPVAALNFALDLATGNLISAVVDVALLVVDIVQGLISLFSGKPRAQDTITVSTRLMHSKNPSGYILGASWMRLLQDRDIVLSSSDPRDQHLIGQARRNAIDGLAAQGVAAERAKQLIDNVELHTTSATQPLPAELTAPLRAGTQIVGPGRLADDYMQHYNQRVRAGDSPNAAAKKAMHWVIENSRLADLLQVTVRAGDGTSPSPQPPPGCTDPCLAGVIASVNNLLTVVAALNSTISSAADADAARWQQCCAELMQRLDAIAQALKPAPGAGGGVDLRPLLDELERIRAARDYADVTALARASVDKGLIDADVGQILTA
jgi:hypothetical protein